uniref:Protein kinase domain-containing protein n=1 Tax=Setaria digitata TaxID=48799 RepID=A0A915PK24_9BILA
MECEVNGKMPVVGTEITLKGKQYHIQSELYDGPFSKVYVINTGCMQYAMKIERTAGSKRPVLKLDALVLKQLNRQDIIVGFPRLIVAGRTPLYKYVIMELVGPDLQRLRRSIPTKKFSLSTSLRLASQTLKRIEALHDCGWLCRDVKANNFCIGKENMGLIYMLDFGFARRFIRENGTPIERRNAASLMGTIYYAPMNAHNFSEQCRKDDLESWFYMIIEMIVGRLPWFIHDPKKEYLLVGEWKRFTRGPGRQLLLADSPTEFEKILDIIDQTAFNDRPRYRVIHAFINQAMDRLKVDKTRPFEWQEDPKVLRKITVLGEHGESNLANKFLQRKGNECKFAKCS